MAHSLIPIVIGYVFAHYLTYLIERGQQTVILLLGLDAEVNYVLSMHPSVLATLKVSCVVAGHVAGVIAAHDRALRLSPASGRYPAGRSPADRTVGDDAGDGRLHVHRVISPVRRVTPSAQRRYR